MVTCPRCGKSLREINGKYGVFYGCSGYPACKFTMDSRAYTLALRAQTPPAPKKEFVPSKYQTAIFEFIKTGTGNAFVEACPGSGKTTSIVQSLDLTTAEQEVLFCAFGKNIAEELGRRAPAHVMVATLHSLGFRVLRENLPTVPEVDDGKVMGIIKEMQVHEDLHYPLASLVALCKSTLTDPEDIEQLSWLVEHYQVDTGDEEELLFSLVPKVLTEDMKRLSVIDYDDMPWLPIILRLPIKSYDWVFVDEAQDLNAVQIEFVMKLVKPNGRAIFVGDRQQSIFGFRGADVEAIDKIVARLNCTCLPLSITYRCPKTHVEFARRLIPRMETAPNAKEGLIEYANIYSLLKDVQDGDLVLCRVNAPLVDVAYTLIRRGVKAVIRGRDIGEGLLALIDRLRPRDLYHLIEKARDYKYRESAKLKRAGKIGQLQALQDKIDTLLALCDGIENLTELRARINSIFNNKEKHGVILSSVHRAKGDEAERVWILKPELMPHPMAEQAWELEQEKNLQVVAYTRSKNEMVFVSDDH